MPSASSSFAARSWMMAQVSSLEPSFTNTARLWGAMRPSAISPRSFAKNIGAVTGSTCCSL